MKIIKDFINDSIFRNSFYLMVTNVTTFILGFFFWIIAARYYTPNDIGIVSALLSSVSLISMISSIGLPTALLFYLPRSKNANIIINSSIIVSIIVASLFSIIFILGVKIWEPSLIILNKMGLAIIFIIITISTTISALMSGAFTAGQRSSFHMIKENLFSLIKILPLVLLVGLGSIGIFLSWGVGLVIATLIGFVLLYIIWSYTPKITFDPIIKSMAGFSIGNYISGIFSNLPKMILPIIIVGLISPESAGYFFIAITIASLLHNVPLSIGNSLLAQSHGDDFWSNVIKSIRLNLYILLPGVLSFIIFGRIVLNLFNHEYAEHATNTLIILSITSFPLSIINIFNTIRIAQKRISSTIKVNAITAIITLILSIPMMKQFNIEGTAFAYLIGNTIVALIVIIRIKNPREFAIGVMTKNTKS